MRVRLPLSAPSVRIQIDRIFLSKWPKAADPRGRLTAVLTAVEAGTHTIVQLTPAGPGPIGWLPRSQIWLAAHASRLVSLNPGDQLRVCARPIWRRRPPWPCLLE